MTRFANFSELYASGGTFDKQEVVGEDNVTTIYGGYAPFPEPSADTEGRNGWLIRRLIVIEDGNTQNIECTWATGSWAGRATLDYTYQKP